jgi:hypothetical protein
MGKKGGEGKVVYIARTLHEHYKPPQGINGHGKKGNHKRKERRGGGGGGKSERIKTLKRERKGDIKRDGGRRRSCGHVQGDHQEGNGMQ